jgi:hypothetical protein
VPPFRLVKHIAGKLAVLFLPFYKKLYYVFAKYLSALIEFCKNKRIINMLKPDSGIIIGNQKKLLFVSLEFSDVITIYAGLYLSAY